MAGSTAEKTREKELHEKHAATIKAYENEAEMAEAARGLGNKKEAESHNAKKSNRSREVRAIELEMATEGITFTPWDKPKSSRNGKSKPPVTKEQLEEDLAKVARVFNGDFPESTKETANARITALLKQAERLEYKVTDPRSE